MKEKAILNNIRNFIQYLRKRQDTDDEPRWQDDRTSIKEQGPDDTKVEPAELVPRHVV